MKSVEFESFPTRTAPTGPFQGISDKAREADAAFCYFWTEKKCSAMFRQKKMRLFRGHIKMTSTNSEQLNALDFYKQVYRIDKWGSI